MMSTHSTFHFLITMSKLLDSTPLQSAIVGFDRLVISFIHYFNTIKYFFIFHKFKLKLFLLSDFFIYRIHYILKIIIQSVILQIQKKQKKMSFKVEKLTQINTLSKTQNVKYQQTVSKKKQVIMSIPAVPILTYSSHALIEILTSFFQSSQSLPSYHMVQKALKIISITKIDEILTADIESLILKNIHKKNDIYIFFCLWAQYLKIDEIIQRFSNPKTQQKIIYTILFVFISQFATGVLWYQKLALSYQIQRLFNHDLLLKFKILQQIDAQISSLVVNNFYHFKSIVIKLIQVNYFTNQKKSKVQFQKMLVNMIRNKSNSQFINQMTQIFVSSKQNQETPLVSLLIAFFNENNLKEGKEIITTSINKILNNKIISEKNQSFFSFIETLFGKKQTQKQANKYLKDAVKNWLATIQQNTLWQFFNNNFIFTKNVEQSNLPNILISKRVILFDIFADISKQNQRAEKQTQKMIFSSYFYRFFEGKPFDFSIEQKFLEIKEDVRFESQRQTILKSLKHLKNEKFLNIMIFNKSSFPSSIDWQIDIGLEQIIKKFSKLNQLRKLINEIKQQWEKIESQMLRDNKKIELIFSVMRVYIDKRLLFLTVNQLIELLISINQGKIIDFSRINTYHYRSQYQPILRKSEIKGNKSILVNKEQEIHPIVIQAKIIKLMKKTLKKATIIEISKALNLDQQKSSQSVKKLVNKGYLVQNEDGTYSYQP